MVNAWSDLQIKVSFQIIVIKWGLKYIGSCQLFEWLSVSTPSISSREHVLILLENMKVVLVTSDLIRDGPIQGGF